MENRSPGLEAMSGIISLSVLLTLLLIVVAGPMPSAVARSRELLRDSLIVDGLKRRYILHIPKSGLPALAPLVIVLHGGMENGAVIRKLSRMDEEADRSGFIVAYPYGTGKLKSKLLTWNSFDCCGYAMKEQVDDVKFMGALMDKLQSQYKIDANRIFICGYSNGAMLAYRVACELSDRIAAIASVGGSMSGKEKVPADPVSVLIIHGTADRHVPYNGGGGKWERFGYAVNRQAVSYAFEFWKKASDCREGPFLKESKDLKTESYRAHRKNIEVKLISLEGAGHAWPGGRRSLLYTDKPFSGMDASRECWRFFSEHPKVLRTGEI